jgi:hypothetical protein
MDEPGEHHFKLERTGETDVAVRVIWHDNWASWGNGSGPAGRVVLEGVTSVAKLRGQTYSAARSILESLGAEEYKRRWAEHEFPAASYARLAAAGQ